MSAPHPSAELRARVLAAVRAEPAPARPAGVTRSAVAVAAGLAAGIVILLLIGGPETDGRPPGYFAAMAVAWSAVGVASAWAGVARGRSMLGRPAVWRVAVAGLTPAALVATALAAALAWPSTLAEATTMRQHLTCLELGTLMALGPLAAFVFVRRRSDPVAPRLTGAAIGAGSGALGALFIELRCGHAPIEHVVLGHVVPVAVLTLIGVWLGGWAVAVRAQDR